MAPVNHCHIGYEHLHRKWTQKIAAALTVDQGVDVSFDLMDSCDGQLSPDSTAEDVKNVKLELCDPVFGPVFINGAEPGDVLEVEFLDLKPGSWGFTCVMPGFGLLGDEFPEPAIKHFNISPEDTEIKFNEEIRVPIRPFLGCSGVAPKEAGEFSTIPPLESGGNIDCRHLTIGTKLYLPVSVPGALFSCGDGHAAQGDGEVCGTAVEVAMKAVVRFRVHKDKPYVQSPHFDTSGSFQRKRASVEETGSYAVLGIDSDLRQASRKAVRSLMDYLVNERNLSRVEAYMLTSIAGDLKIAEIVDMPNYAVSASIPFSIFRNNQREQ